MSANSSQTLDLTKLELRKNILLNLVKTAGLQGQKAQVALAIDHSGSMDWLYKNGTVQDTIERIVPIACTFDDNQELELFVFSNDCIKHKNPVTVSNVANFVKREMSGYYYGGTNYAPVIISIMDSYLKKKSSGLFNMFKKSEPSYEISKMQYPVYVIFITDGENSDHSETEAAIREAANHGIFFQFVGIGSEKFKFLEKLDTLRGRYIDNANFFKLDDLSIDDDLLYNMLLTEFPSWCAEARSKSLIV